MVARAKVHGGIITDQMLTGSQKYYKIVAPFGYVLSDNTVKLDSKVTGGDTPKTYFFTVPDGVSVPTSAGEQVLQLIQERCTIVNIGLVQSGALTTEIHIACENTSNGWETAADMQAAIQAMGPAEDGVLPEVPTTSGNEDPTIGTADTETINVSGATVTEVPFLLA